MAVFFQSTHSMSARAVRMHQLDCRRRKRRQYTAGSRGRRKADWPTWTRRSVVGGEPGRAAGARTRSSLSVWSAARRPSPVSHCPASALSPPSVSTTLCTDTAEIDASTYLLVLT